MVCFLEVVIFLGFVNTYMVLLDFYLHRSKSIAIVDFILKLIPAVFAEFRDEFFLCHPVFNRNNRKALDIGSPLSFGFPASGFCCFIFFILGKAFNSLCFIEINDVAIHL